MWCQNARCWVPRHLSQHCTETKCAQQPGLGAWESRAGSHKCLWQLAQTSGSSENQRTIHRLSLWQPIGQHSSHQSPNPLASQWLYLRSSTRMDCSSLLEVVEFFELWLCAWFSQPFLSGMAQKMFENDVPTPLLVRSTGRKIIPQNIVSDNQSA